MVDHSLTLHIAAKLSVENSERSDSIQWKVSLQKDFHPLPFKVVEVKGGWQVKFWDFDLEIFPGIIAKNIVLQNTP